MSVDGIWTGEINGPYGWENSGVYVLERGRLLGGNNRHYSVGSYSISGSTYTADVTVHYYGPPRTIFGEAIEEFKIKVAGTIHGAVIDAHVERADRPQFTAQYRMTRRMDLPEVASPAGD